jgi:putative membrane protein
MNEYLVIVEGWLIGVLSGLLPGIHLNTIVSIMEQFSIPTAALFGALAGAQMIAEFIPSILLAAPSEELALSVLPAQRLLQKGEANRGILAALVGVVFGTLAFLTLLPASLVALPWIYESVYPHLGWLLIIFSGYLIWTERESASALFIFLMAGVFGVVVLNSPQPNSTKLYAMLTGCFGVATLLMGLLSKQKLPEQKMSHRVSNRTLPGGLIGTFSGFLVGTFPAISCSQAVALLSPLLKSEEAFIAAVSSASVSSMLFSALTLSILGRARNGAMASLGQLGFISTFEFIAAFLVAILPSLLLVLFLSNNILKFLKRFYKQILLSVFIFLMLLSIYFGGWWALLVLITSSALGILTISLGVRRTQCMAMLILPTILFYLGIA